MNTKFHVNFLGYDIKIWKTNFYSGWAESTVFSLEAEDTLFSHGSPSSISIVLKPTAIPVDWRWVYGITHTCWFMCRL
jgi:hypothetical protein